MLDPLGHAIMTGPVESVFGVFCLKVSKEHWREQMKGQHMTSLNLYTIKFCCVASHTFTSLTSFNQNKLLRIKFLVIGMEFWSKLDLGLSPGFIT